MKLRTKIKLSFVIITIIPIFLTMLFSFIIGNLQVKKLELKYGMAVNEFSFILIKVDDKVIYDGSGGKRDELVDILTDSDTQIKENKREVVKTSNSEYIVRTRKIEIDGLGDGDIYFITEYGKMFPQVKIFMLQIVIIMLAVVILTAGGLTLWIHQSIMKPIKELGKATNNIADGNLDFNISNDTDDEFGELCRDFEYMRKKLKETAEEKIKNDNESKELISNISHDLKTPITSIKGYVEGIMDGVADTPEKMDKYIKTIYNKANDMDKLIGELTEYSKIDTNRLPYNFSKVNVAGYFEDCVDELNIDLEQKGIRLNYINYVDEDTIIIADAEQFKRVINNIVNNSVKYIGNKQGIINIRINDEEEFVHIEIEDNGKGIAKKDLPLVFERFYRTDSSRNSNQGGSGIGLSIAKKIIEEHGGRIWAASKEGMGTTMHIVLRKYITNMEADKDE